MQKYPKMLNLFKFDEKTKGRKIEFVLPEFECLSRAQWTFTEKIDGMNIRVIFDNEGEFKIRGRTDAAELHRDLERSVYDLFKTIPARNVTFYGEGYGPGIQKGACYRADKSFLLFDVVEHRNDEFVDYRTVRSIGAELDLPMVPELFTGDLWAMYHMVRAGLKSSFGDFFAEGAVGRPTVPVLDSHGERLIVKIKHRDYYGKELIV